MKLYIALDDRQRKDGNRQILIKYNHAKIGTGVICRSENFSSDGLVTSGDAFYKTKNAKILNLYNLIETNMDDRLTDKEFINLCNVLRGKKSADKNFIFYFDEFMKTKTKTGTLKTYSIARKYILEFDSSCSFRTMSRKWLINFDAWMIKKEFATNYRSIIMRNIRAVFNYCIDEEYTTLYPFRKFSIKHEETVKRSLSVEQLRELRDFKVEKHQEKFRDMFMLMFYLIGINGADLFNLTKDNIQNGYIVYHRSKTNRLYKIKIEPEAENIFEKYEGTERIISLAEEWDYQNFLHRMAIELQRIGPCERVGRGGKKIFHPVFPGLTSYWSRHTWATLAAQLDIPVETISQALGHSEGDTTHIYIKYDNKKIDDANRKVIDFVNSDIE